jgi:hypothetical protein
MMNRSHLLGAVPIQALALLFASSVLAQQSLPTIDVGGVRNAARASHSNAPRSATGPSTGRVSPGPRLTTPAGSLANSTNSGLNAALICPGEIQDRLNLPT